MQIAQKHTRFVGFSVIVNFRAAQSPKLGITVSRHFGNSVQRNRFKRLVREAFRHSKHLFPPLEMVVLPKKGAPESTLSTITRDLLDFAHAQSPTTKSG